MLCGEQGPVGLSVCTASRGLGEELRPRRGPWRRRGWVGLCPSSGLTESSGPSGERSPGGLDGPGLPAPPVRVGVSVRPRLPRCVNPRTPARTRRTAATGTPSASTWATSATPCTSVSARRATRATGSSAGRTQTWTAGPTRTWCAPPTPPTTASRCGRPTAVCLPGTPAGTEEGRETPGHPPHLPPGFLQIPVVVLEK